MLCLDNYRHLSLFLDVRTFLNLTTCSKNLRKLYRENIIWESFIRRDFSKYLHHPSYTLERYIKCKKRTYLDFLENEMYERKAFGYLLSCKNFIYIDKNEHLMKIIPCKEWGLIYNGRSVISRDVLLYLNMLITYYYSDFKTLNGFELIQNIYEIAKIEDDYLKKYSAKSADLIYNILKNEYKIKFENDWISEEYKKDPNYEYMKNIWLELGFQ